MNVRAVAVSAAALAVIAVAGCGGSGHQATSPNMQACQHFRVQGQKFAALAAPTLADMAQAVAWVQEDAALATDPQLRRDFRHWVADVDQMMSGHQPAGNPKTAIVAACARYGIKAA